MSTRNATISIRKRSCELKLTFEFANHIMQNFINDNGRQPLNFLQIQKVAKHSKYYHEYKRICFGYGNYEDDKYLIVVILEQHSAIVKTCYKIENNSNR